MSRQVTEESQESTAHQKKVLVVEDERLSYEGLEAELPDRDLGSDVAKTMTEAVSRLAINSYAAVILDLLIPPGEDPRATEEEGRGELKSRGLEVFTRIREGEFARNGTAADVPVFVLTAVSDASTMQALQPLNPQEIFIKPVSPGALAEAVKLHLHRSS